MTVCAEIEFQFERVEPISRLLAERFEVFVDGRPLGYVIHHHPGWRAELHRDTESSEASRRIVGSGLAATREDAAWALWDLDR